MLAFLKFLVEIVVSSLVAFLVLAVVGGTGANIGPVEMLVFGLPVFALTWRATSRALGRIVIKAP